MKNKAQNILVVGGTEAERAQMVEDKLAALRAGSERAIVYDPQGVLHKKLFNPKSGVVSSMKRSPFTRGCSRGSRSSEKMVHRISKLFCKAM